MRVRVRCPNATSSLEASTMKLQTRATHVLKCFANANPSAGLQTTTAPQHRLLERVLLRYSVSSAAKAVMSQIVSRALANTMEY